MQELAEILVFQVDLTRDDVLAAGEHFTSPHRALALLQGSLLALQLQDKPFYTNRLF